MTENMETTETTENPDGDDSTKPKKPSLINDTQALILGRLQHGPMVGADIDAWAKTYSGVWSATRSQLYREIHLLHQKGLIEAMAPIQERKQAVPYRITVAGITALDAWYLDDEFTDQLRNPWLLRMILQGEEYRDPGLYRRAVQYYSDAMQTLAVIPEEEHTDIHKFLMSYYNLLGSFFWAASGRE